MEAFGRIDVLATNAGYGSLGLFEEIGHDAISKQFEINVYGTMHVTRTLLPAMARSGPNTGPIANAGPPCKRRSASRRCGPRARVSADSYINEILTARYLATDRRGG